MLKRSHQSWANVIFLTTSIFLVFVYTILRTLFATWHFSQLSKPNIWVKHAPLKNRKIKNSLLNLLAGAKKNYQRCRMFDNGSTSLMLKIFEERYVLEGYQCWSSSCDWATWPKVVLKNALIFGGRCLRFVRSSEVSSKDEMFFHQTHEQIFEKNSTTLRGPCCRSILR